MEINDFGNDMDGIVVNGENERLSPRMAPNESVSDVNYQNKGIQSNSSEQKVAEEKQKEADAQGGFGVEFEVCDDLPATGFNYVVAVGVGTQVMLETVTGADGDIAKETIVTAVLFGKNGMYVVFVICLVLFSLVFVFFARLLVCRCFFLLICFCLFVDVFMFVC